MLHSRADIVLRFAFPLGQGRRRPSSESRRRQRPTAMDCSQKPWAATGTRPPHGCDAVRPDWATPGYWTHPFTAPSVLRALRGSVAHELRTLPTLQQITWSLAVSPELPDWKNRVTNAHARHRPLG